MQTFLTVFAASTLGFTAASFLSTWVLAKLAQRQVSRFMAQRQAYIQAAMQHEQERMKAYLAMEA